MYKVAFVSGASRGIGRAIATSLAKEGYHLGVVCRKNQKMLEDLAEDLRSVYHIEVLTFTGDVGDPSFVKALAEEMLAHFSQIDVLVNNAGISHIGLLTDMSGRGMGSDPVRQSVLLLLHCQGICTRHGAEAERSDHKYFFHVGQCRGFL